MQSRGVTSVAPFGHMGPIETLVDLYGTGRRQSCYEDVIMAAGVSRDMFGIGDPIRNVVDSQVAHLILVDHWPRPGRNFYVFTFVCLTGRSQSVLVQVPMLTVPRILTFLHERPS